MAKLISFRRIPEPRQTTRPSLLRKFVETGDERCPLAGIWTRLAESDATAEDPEIIRPVIRRLLSWRAFSYLLHIPSLT